MLEFLYMTTSRQLLHDLLQRSLTFPKKGQRPPLFADLKTQLALLSPEELASHFVELTFAGESLRLLRDQQWNLEKESGSVSYAEFLKDVFSSNLLSLSHLQDFLSLRSIKDLRVLGEIVTEWEPEVLAQAARLSAEAQKRFLQSSLHRMVAVFADENALVQTGNTWARSLEFSLYRTFDGLDQILGFHYEADLEMKRDNAVKERLYEGAGVGVQSSYSTLLTALREIQPRQGARIVDLGSGYGRVGLVVGLLRPDMEFVGYEYVPHRVQISNDSCARFGVQEHVHFYTQDLSEQSFRIPDAEIYYMFDPFTRETYLHVLAQLVEVSRRQRIVIVTKGNARHWLQEIAATEGWPAGRSFDGGNLGIFCSAEAELSA